MTRAFISAILLAAGESKRLSGSKLFLPFSGSTVMEAALDNLLASDIDEVLVVLGHRSDEAIRLIGSRAVRIAVNPDYRLGMSTSIARGMELVDNKASGILLALADQPLVSPAIIDRLVSEFRSSPRGIALPVCRGRRGHPVIFSMSYRDELKRLKGDIGARELLDRHREDVQEVAVDTETVLTDIDTPGDYRALRTATGL